MSFTPVTLADVDALREFLGEVDLTLAGLDAPTALAQAARSGATRAWLFSRRSGPFWQKLGFAPADRDELARVLPQTHQVRLFVESGQLGREVAWSRALDDVSSH